MARARILKPGFFTNELLAEIPFEGRLLFAGLWTLADKEGRLEDRPKRIKASLFPWDEVKVDSLLGALAQRGFIDRYVVNGMALIQIAKFNEHQAPHVREAASILPGPTDEPRKGSVSPPPRSPVSDPVPVTGRNGTEVDSPEALTRSVPFLEFSVVGRGSKVWPLSDSQVLEWERDFPNLDVRAECRKARAWVEANPGRRKTGAGMPRFLVNWLSRCTDRRSGSDRRAEDQPFTTAELKHAREVYKVRMGCRHEPRCAGGIGQCVELIAKEIREKAQPS